MLKLRWVWVLVCLLGCKRGGSDVYEGLKGARFKDEHAEIAYRFFVPEQADEANPLPLVIYLHSNGRQGFDNRKQVDFRVTHWLKDQREHPCFVLAPQLPSGFWVRAEPSGGNFPLSEDRVNAPLKTTMALIEKLLREHPIDRDRIYVVGTSIGGFATWSLLALKPEWIAAAVPIEGGGDPTQVERFEQIPIWAFHGAKDETVPVASSRQMIEALRNAGASPRYTEYPDVNHDSPRLVFAPETKLSEWLFAQRKP